MTRPTRHTRVADIDLPRVTWTVDEVAAQLGIGYDAVAEMINKGELAHVQAGRRKLVPVTELERYVAQAARNAG